MVVVSYSTTTPVLINPPIYSRMKQADSSGTKLKKNTGKQRVCDS